MWACERFEKYLCGLDEFKLVTDHKPLVPLINNRSLDNVPVRYQRLLMRLMRFKPIAEYAPGKTIVVADTLSRSPQTATTKETETHADVECYWNEVIQGIPATSHKMDCIRNATTTDGELQAVIKLIRAGWPQHRSQVAVAAREYTVAKAELTKHQGLVIKGRRIVVF